MNGIIFNGTFTGLLTLALYFKIGEFKSEIFDESNVGEYTQWVFNLSGLGFLLSNNISFSSSTSVIL